MSFATWKNSEGATGATIIGFALAACVVAAVAFSVKNARNPKNILATQEKYPAKAFVAKRNGKPESSNNFTGIRAANGMSVDMKLDKAEQKLSFKISDQQGKPVSRVVMDARARKVGNQQKIKKLGMKETEPGAYSTDPMGLEKGGWVLMVSAYDLFSRGENKLLFHTEQPVFFK